MGGLSEIYAEIRKSCDAAGGQSRWAEQHDLSPAYVSDVLHGRRDPGPKILAALGYVRRVTYQRSNRNGG